MKNLPQEFIRNMQKQLPENEWEAFFAVYNEKPYKGVRINPLKGEPAKIRPLLPFLEETVAWEENGFYTQEEKLGSSPFHSAGLFYSQEPSAMSASPLLEVQAGERVLDLCSAPGGKGTQLASRMNGEGIILLNEPVSSRAKILSQNVERMGIKNAVVTSELPERLSERFVGYFDKILVDAPCSGEGMFRKNAEEALGEWSEENVALCAKRQRYILEEATKMLKVGGRLVYSTCTFAVEEDEGQVEAYLSTHPNMRLIKTEKLYPHRVKGEGHFVALFEKVDGESLTPLKTVKATAGKVALEAYKAFEKTLFHTAFAKNLHEVNGVLYALPDNVFDWKGLQTLRVGVRLGEVKNGRFEPNHSLAMCLKKEECKNVVEFSSTDTRVDKYLHGETVEAETENGWCLVCVEGYPIGWGKAVNGVIKNHLPKGLRRI
ncbi:MAG: hypothetical protein E7368_03915 [Clostridiales bacterium]|nr:hypothetical protein [Clostridiales bacterium]